MKFIRPIEIAHLRRLGFTVTVAPVTEVVTITGGTDTLLAKALTGGKARVALLKKRQIR